MSARIGPRADSTPSPRTVRVCSSLYPPQSMPIATETQPPEFGHSRIGGGEFETCRPVGKIILQPWFKLALIDRSQLFCTLRDPEHERTKR